MQMQTMPGHFKGRILARAKHVAMVKSRELHRRSCALASLLVVRMETLIASCVAVTVALGLVKVLLAPLPPADPATAIAMMLPFLLVAAAPLAGYRVTANSFPLSQIWAQPTVRLARYGTWRHLDVLAARSSPAYGPTGLMASLLAGIMLNVPFRTAEYMLAVPAMGPGTPDWAGSLLLVMTIDLVAMNFWYMACGVMAMRGVPLFPRTLVFAWCIDVILQLSIATWAATADLPAPVTAALHSLLNGNIDKVLISALVWLPYLILSERVNVRFRHRTRLG